MGISGPYEVRTMVRPDRESFLALASQGRPGAVPLVREVLADLDTPLATFLKVDDGASSFLFESAEGEGTTARVTLPALGSGGDGGDA